MHITRQSNLCLSPEETRREVRAGIEGLLRKRIVEVVSAKGGEPTKSKFTSKGVSYRGQEKAAASPLKNS